MRDPDLLKPQADAALVEALKLHRLKRLKDSGQPPNAEDEAALLTLVAAKMAALDRAIRLKQVEGAFVSRGDVFALTTGLTDAVQRHVPDVGVLRAIRDEFQRLMRMGGYTPEDDDGKATEADARG